MAAVVWEQWFAERAIEVKPPPFGRPAASTSSESDIQACQKDLKDFAFPVDFAAFCITVGPGTLGRVKIFTPATFLWFADVRFHNYRLADKFSQPDFQVVHSFPLTDLVVFGVDVEEDLWFAWRRSLANKELMNIMSNQDEQPRAPPPKKVAGNFVEFVSEVCFGTKMKKLKLRKFTEDASRAEHEEESWSDSDENSVQEAAELDLPPKVFRQFSASQ